MELRIEDKYRIVAEHTSDTIVLVDNDAVVRFVSPSIRALSGYDIEQYEGTDAFAPLHPEDRDRVRAAHAEVVRSNRPVDLEYRLFHASGHLVYVEARVKPVLDDNGNVRCVVAVARDVTERKQAEQLLENILDNVNAAVWSTDKDFAKYRFCSDSMVNIIGMPKEEIMVQPIRLHDHIHPDDNAVLMGEVKAKLDRGMPVTRTIRMIHVEGETRWGRLIIHPYLDRSGQVERIDGILMDVTEKKRSEDALEESEQRYKSLFENNLDGVFSIELDGFYFVNANRSFEQITGIELDKLTDRCFLGLIKDEDHSTVYEALFGVMQRREPADIECRLAAGRGEKIVSITFVPIFLFGELNGIHGIVKDITERKREERELIESEERYKTLQQSLNRFSNDLANVMKVSELENRLLDEVRAVLPASRAAIEEAPGGPELPSEQPGDIRIKIGEKKRHPVHLRLAMDRPMLRIEEEWLETAVHYVTILYDNLQLIEDLMKRLEEMVTNDETPKWMLRLLFRLSEKERAALSGDLHDTVLQDLIIWYRKLESLRSARAFDEETKRELVRIEEGLLDAIHQIRITCNELRPPFLLKMGLVESLKSLFAYARMFANYEIEFAAEPADIPLPLQEEHILGVYRIVQELLNNAGKHSGASKVTMSLSSRDGRLLFAYADDGVGMDVAAYEGSFAHMGLAGIEKRVLSLEGEMRLDSAPGHGFRVEISLPIVSQSKGERYGHFAG
ncbi:PAS domain S-box protein [Paenibacillus flagellatus]|uniref:histidine kinase n=1 Tax=Paenibacillus flagellatus TaxID=2211139 RepID=A0A2V5KCD8_9BACL|nr:PAS domain S-box protein [Paenibacillus flagellatus]PYI57261.1 histidine kinase [Paenibacillus flagellatus]